VVLGYDERGHCPMLIDGRCSIYEHRPRACRTYDCRVFAAAGVEADQAAIALRSQRWVFSYPEPGDRALQEAIRRLAREYPRPDARPIEKAVRAVEEADL
jgi:Fe-S-cluster containining protein